MNRSVIFEDVEFLDAYAAQCELGSRSTTLQCTIDTLREGALSGSYSDAWTEWTNDAEADVWGVASGDRGR